MNDNQFDDLFRKRLEENETDVPSDMWERIMANKPKRRGGLFYNLFLLIALLLLIGGATYYFLFNNDKSAATSLNKVSILKRIANANNTNIKIEDTNLRHHNLLKQLKPDTDTNIDTTRKVADEFKTRLSLNIKKNKKPVYAEHEVPGETNKPFSNNEFNTDSKTESDNKLTNDTLTKTPVNDNPTINADSVSSSEKTEAEINHEKFSIELYASPDVAFNGISAADKAYEQALKNAGSMQISSTLGAKIKLNITKKLSAKTGLQFTQVNQHMTFKDSLMAGNSIEKNHYKNIGVPLLISYKLNGYGGLLLSLNTGIIVNITSKYTGAISSISGERIDLNTSNIYNHNVSAAFYLGADFSKKVNAKTDLFGEPWFSYGLKNMVSSSHLFKQKIHTAGVSLGLRYRLYKTTVE